MKVLFIAPQMTTGGAERMVADLGAGLVSRGHRVGIASSGGHFSAQLAAAGASNHVDPRLATRRPFGLGRVALSLAVLLRRERYDDVNSQSYVTSVAVYLAIRLARAKAKHVYTLHLVEDPRTYWLMGRTLGRTTDGIIAVSASNKARLVERGIEDDHVRVVHNGVDLSAFPQSAKRRRRGPLRVGIVARLIERKGHDALLRAVAKMADRMPVTVDLIGSGPEEERLRGLAAELGVTDAVRFLGDRADVPELLSELDVFVLPSRYEGFPISIIEAMATGLPVVATSVDGIPEIVDDEQTGILVRPRDVDGLAAALVRLAGDAGLRRRLGDRAARLVRERFTVDAMTDATLAWYERVLDD